MLCFRELSLFTRYLLRRDTYSRLIVGAGGSLVALMSVKRLDRSHVRDTHKRNVSRQTASRIGKDMSSSKESWSSPEFARASFSSSLIFSCHSECSASICKVSHSAIEVVSVAAKTRVLNTGEDCNSRTIRSGLRHLRDDLRLGDSIFLRNLGVGFDYERVSLEKKRRDSASYGKC